MFYLRLGRKKMYFCAEISLQSFLADHTQAAAKLNYVNVFSQKKRCHRR